MTETKLENFEDLQHSSSFFDGPREILPEPLESGKGHTHSKVSAHLQADKKIFLSKKLGLIVDKFWGSVL